MSRSWVRWTWATCSVAFAVAACGHTTSDGASPEPSPPSAGAGGSNSSAPTGHAGTGGGRAGAFGGTAPTTGGSGTITIVDPAPSAGAPSEPMPHAAEPCEDAQPSPYGGGFEHCADGSFRRHEPAACNSTLPRSEPAKDRLLDECEYDADCTEQAHGYCEWGECLYGCVEDSECGSGELCWCGPTIGHCRFADCRSDADCPADYPCTGNAYDFSLYFEVQCQTPLDECQSDNDCGNEADLHQHCVSEHGTRWCQRIYVG